MPDRDHLLRLWTYHHWAAERLFNALAGVDAAQLDKPWGGSFKTGRGLLQHVVGADRIWTTRWNGSSPASSIAFPASHSGSDFRDEWLRVKADQQRFLESAGERRFNEPLRYSNLKGEAKSFPFAEVLVHLVNHGTYHRGQIAHLLRDLGLNPPSTDYVLFAEERPAAGATN